MFARIIVCISESCPKEQKIIEERSREGEGKGGKRKDMKSKREEKERGE